MDALEQQKGTDETRKPRTFGTIKEAATRGGGKSTSWCWAAQHRAVNPFPKPVKIGGSSRFILEDVDAWVDREMALTKTASPRRIRAKQTPDDHAAEAP